MIKMIKIFFGICSILLLFGSVNGALVLNEQLALNRDLYKSIRRGNIVRAATLIINGADVNALPERDFRPLHTAVIFAKYCGYSSRMVKLLLACGADVDALDPFGDTALLLACRNDNNTTIVSTLFDYGANIQSSNYFGSTPIRIVQLYGSKRIAHLLLEKMKEQY